jgi:DNA modification methylase
MAYWFALSCIVSLDAEYSRQKFNGAYASDCWECSVSEGELVHLAPDQLKPYGANAKVHSKVQVRQIAESIQAYGFNAPIVIDENDGVLAGHGRLDAAKQLKLKTVPCFRVRDLSEAAKRAYRLADNKIAENAVYDWEIVAGELKALCAVEYDMQITGYSVVEIDRIIHAAEASSPKPQKADRIPEVGAPAEAICRPGEIWRLGRHKLLCGDARDPDALGKLMQSEQAAMAFVDAPYNRSVTRDLSSRGAVRHGEFAMASGEMARDEYIAFLTQALQALKGVCKDGAIAFSCIDWRSFLEMQLAAEAAGAERMNVIVWNKSNAGQGHFYRSQYELIFALKYGTAPHTNNFGLGETGRFRSNVWSYAGFNSFKTDRQEGLASHPTPKPVNLVADAICDVSHRGEFVMDTFAGSGTTLIAAHQTGRTARVVEIEPTYCDVIIKRYEAFTGKSAVLDGSGRNFADIQIVRRKQG